MTSANQKPKQDWLNIAQTSRARSKIRLALKETQVKEGLFAKEMLERKFKNRKLEMDDSIMQLLIRKLGFKEVSDFYRQVANGELDPAVIIEKYIELQHRATSPSRAITWLRVLPTSCLRTRSTR